MQISAVNNYNNQPQFKAKFLDTPAIRKVAKWAFDNGRYKELNEARTKIDYAAVKVRIHLRLATDTEGYPIAIFRRYFPKFDYKGGVLKNSDFIISRPIIYEGREKNMDPVEFGFKKIIQMGQFISRNQMYKDIVVNPPKSTLP